MAGRFCCRLIAVGAACLLWGITAMAQNWPVAQFPLHISEDRYFLADANNKPFLIQGDAAWSLIAELNRDEVEIYLKDRKARGFNTLLVNLLEHQFSSHPPANANGDLPFGAKAFIDINQAYFDHAAWVLERASEMGFVVFLAPAYLGANGGGQGWYLETQAAGPPAMRAFGQFIAKRLSALNNIVWMLGGDYDSPDKALVEALSQGISDIAPSALQTVHSQRDTNTRAYWAGRDWLSIDTVYSYKNVHVAVLARTGQEQTLPVVLIEALYENEHGVSAQSIREQAYGALLAGAAGQVFGNHPVWHFSGPGIEPDPSDWKTALASPGAQSMTVLRRLFDSFDWTSLQPDRTGQFTKSAKAFAAVTQDERLAIVYGDMNHHDPTMFTVDMATLAMPEMPAFWFDPTSGAYTKAIAEKLDGGLSRFTPPKGENAAGDGDWVLVLSLDN